MVRRPPNFGRQVVAGGAQRFHRNREQDRFADTGDLGPEALLASLGPEGGEVRRQHDASHNLRASVFEGGNLCRKVVGKVLVAAGIDQIVSLCSQRWR